MNYVQSLNLRKERTMNHYDQYLGKIYCLTVIRQTDHGIYLSPAEDKTLQILLPNNQIPPNTQPGDILENIFIYKDSEDRIIATTQKPYIVLGQISILTVKEVTNIGAFLDWGLTKDLFLPFKEQTYPVKAGDQIPVALYIDKSQRLCATMHLYGLLLCQSPYHLEEHVSGIIYEYIDAFGYFVVIDQKYSGLIPKNEITQPLQIGQTVNGRIKSIRDDGKLTLSLKEKVELQMGIDAEQVLIKLRNSGGTLPFHDKTSPEIIKREFKMSKNAFKRAIGRLMKENIIRITDHSIELIQKD